MKNNTLDQMVVTPELVGEGLESLNENEHGATMLEYGLFAVLVAVVCLVASTFLGQRACFTFSDVGSSDVGSSVASG